MKNLQSKVEKSTLGDLSALADIRAKLDGSAAAAELKAAAPTPATEAPLEVKAAEAPATEAKAADADAAADEPTVE